MSHRIPRMVSLLAAGASIVSTAKDFGRPAWEDIRLLGQGDAGLATVSGGVAAFYNPAGLANTTNYTFMLLNPMIATNADVVGSYSSILGLKSSTTLSSQLAPFLGKPLDLQANWMPFFSIPHFMIGFYDMFDSDLEYVNPVFPQLNVNYRNDWGVIAGFGYGYKEYLSAGISLRWINRTMIDQVLDSSTLLTATSSYLDSIKSTGRGWGLNIGFQGHLPLDHGSRLSAGYAIEDLGYTTFIDTDLTKPQVERQPMRHNFGFAYELDMPASRASIFLDAKDVNQFSMSWSKKVYMGLALETRIADFRGGFYQGYWTLGVSVAALPFLQVDIASYGRELESSAGLMQDRYYMLGIRMGLDMKPAEASSGVGGKRRKYYLENIP